MSSSWYKSKAFRIAAVLVVLLVVALLAVPYLFDLNSYRPMIVDQVKKMTGREAEIGNLRLHFLPSLQVVASDLSIGNPAGFPEGDTVTVEEVDLYLSFFPLLTGQVQITEVTVRNAVLNLLENERGQNNYESLLQASVKSGGNGAANGNGAAGMVSLSRIDKVEVENARITSGTFWRREKRVYPRAEVRNVSLRVGGIALDDPNMLSNVRAEMDLDGIEISSPALKEPLRFTGGEIIVSEGKAEGDFALRLGSIRANGTVSVPSLEGKRAAQFTLAANQLDVTAIAALVAGGQAASRGPRRRGDPNKLLARGQVNVDRVVAPPISVQNLKASARLYATRLEVNPFSFNLYGGSAQGTMAMDLAGESMMGRVNAKVAGVEVGQFLAATNPQGEKKITGTLEADTRLGAPLGAGDPLSAATGSGTFAVRDGTFPGLDVQSTLATMAKFMQLNLPTGDTKFSYFGGDFRISNQRVHSNRLQLDAESLEASMSGSVGFDQTLSYNGTGMLKGSGTAQQQQEEKKSRNPFGGLKRVFGQVVQQTMRISGMRVPFSVRGTLEDIKIVPGGAPQPVR